MLLSSLVATIALAAPGRGVAQVADSTASGYNVRLMGGAGLPSSLEFMGRETDGLALVSTLRLGYQGRIRGPFSYSLGVEGLLAQRTGNLTEVGTYKIRTARIGLEGLVGVLIPNTRLTAQVGLQMRNQVDLNELEIRRRDNLRFDLRLAASYPLSSQLHATAMVARHLRNRDDSHSFADPRHQASVGVVWFISSPGRS